MITPIALIEGVVAEAGPSGVVVMTAGVGYGLEVPVSALSRLKVGSEARLHTHFILREDGAHLYGFLSAEERRAFATLLGVTRLGPKGALAVLSAMNPADLQRAVASGDLDVLRRLPGVGPKMAARMVLELRGNLDGTGAFTQALEDEALAALISLGYGADEAGRLLNGLEGDTEHRIRQALQRVTAGEGARS